MYAASYIALTLLYSRTLLLLELAELCEGILADPVKACKKAPAQVDKEKQKGGGRGQMALRGAAKTREKEMEK